MLSVTTNLPVSKLETKARGIRRQVIKMIYGAGSGHPGGSLSSTDILVALFFGGGLRLIPKTIMIPEQTVLFYLPVMVLAGYIPYCIFPDMIFP